jgi:hypothetical protein
VPWQVNDELVNVVLEVVSWHGVLDGMQAGGAGQV